MDVTHSASSGAQGRQEKLVKDGVQGLDGVYRATCSILIVGTRYGRSIPSLAVLGISVTLSTRLCTCCVCGAAGFTSLRRLSSLSSALPRATPPGRSWRRCWATLRPSTRWGTHTLGLQVNDLVCEAGPSG